jgi:hypothetical protein
VALNSLATRKYDISADTPLSEKVVLHRDSRGILGPRAGSKYALARESAPPIRN